MATQKTQVAGALDPGFGHEGRVFFTLDRSAFGGSSKLLSDGRILTVGVNAADLVLVRHLGNGEVDSAFGNQGIQRISLIPHGSPLQASLTLQSNARALVFGSVGDASGRMIYLIRTLSDGKLDSTFGREGRVFIDLPAGEDAVHALAIQPDGKIVLTARVQRDFEDYDEVLLRLDSTGQLDPTFGKAGTVVIGKGEFSSVLALADNRLLLAGFDGNAVLFARYLSDGRPDTDFGESGFVTIEVSSSRFVQIAAAKRQRDGKIVAVGSADLGSKGFHPLITRINPDGSLDSTFNNGSPALIGFQGYEVKHGAVAIQPDNKILAAGASLGSLETANFTLMRLLPNGTLDMEFGSQGRVMTHMGGLDISQDVAVQVDGKIVVSGWVIASPQGTGIGIARYFG